MAHARQGLQGDLVNYGALGRANRTSPIKIYPTHRYPHAQFLLPLGPLASHLISISPGNLTGVKRRCLVSSHPPLSRKLPTLPTPWSVSPRHHLPRRRRTVSAPATVTVLTAAKACFDAEALAIPRKEPVVRPRPQPPVYSCHDSVRQCPRASAGFPGLRRAAGADSQALSLPFDAFCSREPVATSLENALDRRLTLS
jgi:hypothetical protein